MKTLYIVRHAKSSWDVMGQPDEERPLNERGKKDAPEMGKRLKDKVSAIDVFISSPAKRAFRTARHFIKQFGGKKKDIIVEDKLYPGGISDFYEVIATLKNKHDSAAMFAHNPGVTDFVNTLTDQRIDNMPTCSVFGVKADIQSWTEFRDAQKEFVLFDMPGNTAASAD